MNQGGQQIQKSAPQIIWGAIKDTVQAAQHAKQTGNENWSKFAKSV